MNFSAYLQKLHKLYTRKEIYALTGISPSAQKRIEKTGRSTKKRSEFLSKQIKIVGRRKKKKSVTDALVGEYKRETMRRYETARRKTRVIRIRVVQFFTEDLLLWLSERSYQLLSTYYKRLKERQIINLGIEFIAKQTVRGEQNLNTIMSGRNSIALPRAKGNLEKIHSDFISVLERLLGNLDDEYKYQAIFIKDLSVKINTPLGAKNETDK